jgi:ABC-type polysaccharide/polyol phosphate export permease
MVALVVAMPILGVSIGPQVLMLIPACVLLILLSISLSLVFAAVHVYFRDIRYLVNAALLVWFYLTPILYTPQLLRGAAGLFDFNPMTGVLLLFRTATVGADTDWKRPLIVSVVTILVCLVVALETYRRRDRLFADEL